MARDSAQAPLCYLGSAFRPFKPETLVVRKVDISGRISFKNRVWRIGKAFRGEFIALRQTSDDGVFALHYCAHRIAILDLNDIAAQAQRVEQCN